MNTYRTRIIAIVPAGGVGQRAGTAYPKQYRLLAGEAMLRRAVRALLADKRVEQVRVAVSESDSRAHEVLAGLPRTECRPCGGPTRAATVLGAVRDAQLHPDDWVLVHDAARPGLPAEALGRLIDVCLQHGRGGLLAEPVADTVKRARQSAEAGGAVRVEVSVPRDNLWLAQTPQLFPAGLLLAALEASADDPRVTDEASAMELAGYEPLLVPGSIRNFKVTWPEDFGMMERLLATESPIRPITKPAAEAQAMEQKVNIRVGQGFDVHALVEGRDLIIGGVKIPHTHGLLGHSDADVLLHAVTDAILGAAGLGDIGRHFPDTDPRYAGADSRVLLRAAMEKVSEAGWQVVNVDATVHAQAPKIGPHAAAMVANIAADLRVDAACVNVKAKTNENLGYLGRKEGIAATVVALLAGA